MWPMGLTFTMTFIIDIVIIVLLFALMKISNDIFLLS